MVSVKIYESLLGDINLQEEGEMNRPHQENVIVFIQNGIWSGMKLNDR